MAGFVKAVLTVNGLLDGDYAEPYAGGAGIACELLLHEYVRRIHINDIDYGLFCFWQSLLNYTDELCGRISDVSVTIEEWFKQRDIFENQHKSDMLDVGFSTFFLNRTNRSGILHGGVIGGKEQTGRWKLDARFNRKNLIARVQSIASRKNRVALYNLDAGDFIKDVVPGLPKKSLVYLDPPYYSKGPELYTNSYSPQDHRFISERVRADLHNREWIVSYDDVPEVRGLYAAYPAVRYRLSYSAARRQKGSEVMFFASSLEIPQLVAPMWSM